MVILQGGNRHRRYSGRSTQTPGPGVRWGGAALGVLVALAMLLPVAGLAQSGAPSPSVTARLMARIHIIEADKATWTEAEKKLGSDLLYAIKRARGEPLFDRLPTLRAGLDVPLHGDIDLVVRGKVAPALRQAVARQGAVLGVYPQQQTLLARMPLGSLMAMVMRPEVVSIRRDPGYEMRKVNTSEGDVAHRANLARTMFAVDGAGVKVGVLSDGLDSLSAAQASGDLGPVNILPGQIGTGDEGTAMLEIVRDLAPGATLYFATAKTSMAQFAANITALANAGCDVIVDDWFYYAEPTFQDGIVAQAVADFVANGGLYFSSAGNSGNRNDGQSGVWQGDFKPDATVPAVHNFGSTTLNKIVKDAPQAFVLQWSDPFAASSNDYDLYLTDANGNIINTSSNRQDGNDDPFELLASSQYDDVNLYLAVVRYAGSPRFIWLNTHRGVLYHATNGQISGHATVVGAFGVAAVDATMAAGAGGTFNGSESVETFSSDGPRRMFFNRNGVPLTPGNFSSTGGSVRDQPRIAAADGVATSAPGFNPFYGTSAAAPHAAAMAALVLEMAPTTTRAQLDYAFSQSAWDIEANGFDRDSGHGLIDAVSLLAWIDDHNEFIFADGFD